MAGVQVPTPIQNYALGRDCILELLFQSPNDNSANPDFKVGFRVCISEGSVTIESDTLEIPSNCQRGWKVKLPGLKSGTLSFTGFLAISEIPTIDTASHNILQYIGKTCMVAIYHAQVDGQERPTGNEAFYIGPNTGANGVVKSANVSVSPDDVCKMSMVIELSGAQAMGGFIAVAAIQ